MISNLKLAAITVVLQLCQPIIAIHEDLYPKNNSNDLLGDSKQYRMQNSYSGTSLFNITLMLPLKKHQKDAWSVYQSTNGLIVKILTRGLTYTCGNAVKQGENSNRFPLLCCNWRIQLGRLLKQTIKSRMSQWWEENCPVWLVFWERHQPWPKMGPAVPVSEL